MNKRQTEYVLNKLRNSVYKEQQKINKTTKTTNVEKLYDGLKNGTIKLKSKKEVLSKSTDIRYLAIINVFSVPDKPDKNDVKLAKMRTKISEIEDILVLGDSKDALQIIADFNKEFNVDA